jgi:hypothetical protein
LLPGILSTAVHSVLALFASSSLKIPASSSSGAGTADAAGPRLIHAQPAITIFRKIVRTLASSLTSGEGVTPWQRSNRAKFDGRCNSTGAPA